MAYDQVDGHHMAGIPEHGADVEYLMEAVMGGMRIQVGDEVTDNTVVAQLENLKRKVKAGVSE